MDEDRTLRCRFRRSDGTIEHATFKIKLAPDQEAPVPAPAKKKVPVRPINRGSAL